MARGRAEGAAQPWPRPHRPRREAKEAGNARAPLRGELGLDIYGMREPLAKAGLRYFDDEAAMRGS